MTTLERIKEDLAHTPYGTEPEKRELFKILLAEIKLKKGNDPSEEDVLAVVRKFKSNAIECNDQFEVSILDAYLPQMMSEDGMRVIVVTIINARNLTKPSDLGQVMQALSVYGNSIDKKYCSTFAKEILSK